MAHPQWPHIFVVPCFMTHMWRRNLGKLVDVLFTVPSGVPFWWTLQFEPLVVAIVFPLAHISSHTGPWSVKGTDMGTSYKQALAAGSSKPAVGPPTKKPRLEEPRGGGTHPTVEPSGGGGNTRQLHVMDGPLPGMFNDPEAGLRALLRELLASAGRLPPVQRSVWCGKCYKEFINNHFPRLDDNQNGSDLEVDSAYTQHCYQCGRDGDHLMEVPFECDLCSFRNVVGRDSIITDARDEFTLITIRRVLLDVMWA